MKLAQVLVSIATLTGFAAGQPVVLSPNVRARADSKVTNESDARLQFATAYYYVSETNTEVSLQINRAGFTNSTVSVGVRTVEDYALAGQDFVPRELRLEFAPGEVSKLVSVSIIDDAVRMEANEYFRVHLENPGSGAVIDEQFFAFVFIRDDDHFDRTFDAGPIAEIQSLAPLSDGKLVVSGYFTNILNVPRSYIARLNSSGIPDSTFDSNNQLRMFAYAMVAESNDTVLASGVLQTDSPQWRPALVRLLSDGSIDEEYVAPRFSTAPSVLALQSDGKALIAADTLLRLNTDGSIDTTFSAELGALSNAVSAIAVQPNGQVLVGTAAALVRLQSSGARDLTFTEFGAPIKLITLQPDGRILVALPGGCDSGRLLFRLLPDGAPDSSWHIPFWVGFPPPSHIECGIVELDVVLVQSDGRIIVAGSFAKGGNLGLVRLNEDGSPDLDFSPGYFTGFRYTPNWPIFAGGYIQPDGHLVLGGLFKLQDSYYYFGTPSDSGWVTNLVRLPPGPPLVTEGRFIEAKPLNADTLQFTFRFEGTQYYVVEASTDFEHWRPIRTNTEQRLIYTFVETIDDSSRFYRVRPLK